MNKQNLVFFKEFGCAIEPNRGSDGAAGIDFFVPNPVDDCKDALQFMRNKCLESIKGNNNEDDEAVVIINRFNKYLSIGPKRAFLEAVVTYNYRLFGHKYKLAFPSSTSDQIHLSPGEGITIPTGLSADIPQNFAILFQNKSGIASKQDLLVGACLIDEDYKGIMHINIHNVGDTVRTISCGQKLVQGIIIPTFWPMFDVSCKDGHNTGTSQRGDGGFGSTGTTA